MEEVPRSEGRLDDALALTVDSTEPLLSPSTITDAPDVTVLTGDGDDLLALQQSLVRTTVLPKVKVTAGGAASPELVHDGRERYAPVQDLGAGGVGEVALVKDNDIERLVAMKRLKADMHRPGTVLRFAEEVRTIGQLEHPNIVPVHDVGIDENGQLYFVMKYVEGETLESIIEKLADGDPHYHERFTFEYRCQIFTEILRAVGYAHEHGIIHRDIKPANIMVGPYGEVTVMDWGLAKRLEDTVTTLERATELPEDNDEPLSDDVSESQRAFLTQHGALLGTPAYMSPEQALGKTDEIGEGSDIYSLCVTFWELLSLQHYLAHKKTVQGMLMGVVQDELKHPASVRPHKSQGMPPPELWYFVQRGMNKDPADRFSSVDEMLAEMHDIQQGDVRVRCVGTLARRTTLSLSRFSTQSPLGTIMLFAAVGLLALYALGTALYFALA